MPTVNLRGLFDDITAHNTQMNQPILSEAGSRELRTRATSLVSLFRSFVVFCFSHSEFIQMLRKQKPKAPIRGGLLVRDNNLMNAALMPSIEKHNDEMFTKSPIARMCK
jgi:hypothetical protein